MFVFFAGHGATRKLASGRDLGYIIPADSDPAEFATDAIPMTDIQNIAESLEAKHVFFIMDACYSGLGLTRGGNSSRPTCVRTPGEWGGRCSPLAAPIRKWPTAAQRAFGVHLGAAARFVRQGRPE